MSNSDYLWAPGEEAPLIKDHSLAKHEVLGRYLRTYVEVLTSNVKSEQFKLTLVDGFAGGGVYTTVRGDRHHGSPLQMVYAMKEAEESARTRRRKGVFVLDAKYIFIEKNPASYEFLRTLLRNDSVCQPLLDKNKIVCLSGLFQNYVGKVIQEVQSHGRSARAILVLDQYGYSDVPFALIRKIMSALPKAEILLTFATDWLIDYMSSSERGVTRDRLLGMGLSEVSEQFAAVINGKEHKSAGWRHAIQFLLHKDLLQKTGAKYFTPFFIVSPDAHRDYWFVHLSGHPKARDEMTKLHWSIQNRFAHYGGAGLYMLGYDPANDPAISRQQPFDFSAASQQESFTQLRQEIPRLLRSRGDQGMSYDNFFNSVCNNTPATSKHLRDLMRELSRTRELEVVSVKGSLRRRGVQSDTDIIRCPSQFVLDLGLSKPFAR